MKVSVITVAYNSGRTIGDTLRSVATQSYANIEHIVVDGGSTDNTLKQVKQNGRHVALLISEPDGGIYDAMNKGLSFATGDIVGFLNSDDVLYDNNAIQHIAAAFFDDTIDAVFGDLVFVDPSDTSKIVRFWKSSPYVQGNCRKGWMPPHPTFYVRTAALKAAGGFCLDYKLAADFELVLS